MTVTTPLPHSAEQPFVDNGPGAASTPSDALVLDIGGDVGALVLYATEDVLGSEVDVSLVGPSPAHTHDHTHEHDGHVHTHLDQPVYTHTMIRRRRAMGRDIICGVYPELRAGTYTVWGLDGEPIATVTIEGGRVSELDAGDCRTPAG